ncbi:MAG: serine/threonine protein kinase [Gemmataceae bacterium]|nr:serine/threonine protein kinase [Gemmataceae bacterium]
MLGPKPILPPERYEGAPLASLVRVLAQASEGEVVSEWDRARLAPPAPTRGALPPTVEEWRTTSFGLPAPDSKPWLPSYPDVSEADVVLEKYLGGGKQGVVYSGRVRSTGLVVAVKILRAIHGGGESAALREARIGSRLRHANVLRVFESRKVGAFWVVLMEFLQGDDLGRSAPAQSTLRPLLARLADAVQALGSANVVHRDIKPANIVVRRGDGAPVLVDFGLALELETVTGPVEVAGTPLFMAPEALAGERPEPAWDAYALGVTAASLLLGGHLPGPATFSALMTEKTRGEFNQRLEARLTDVADVSLRDWCLRLVAAPADRLAALEDARSWLAPTAAT